VGGEAAEAADLATSEARSGNATLEGLARSGPVGMVKMGCSEDLEGARMSEIGEIGEIWGIGRVGPRTELK